VPARILVVEDDDRVASALSAALGRAGYEVTRVADGGAALAAVSRGGVDLILLDLGLPDLDGLDVCRRIRTGSGVPVIAVTARGAERERVEGLRTGADDYVVKPFALAELLARIEAVLRRGRPAERAALSATVGDVEVDVDRRRVTVAGTAVELTRKEFDLLALLLRRRGTVVGREEILRAVWETDWAGGRTLDVHVASLRHKLSRPDMVRTVRGVGFVIDATG
jgi:DNA-binding response OmpR family regulator